jgi:hypothetical protein
MKRHENKGQRRELSRNRYGARETGASDVNPVVQALQGQAREPPDRRLQMLGVRLQVIHVLGMGGIGRRGAKEKPKAGPWLGQLGDSVDALANLAKEPPRAVQLICLGLAQCKDCTRAASDQRLPDITDDEHRQDRPQRKQGCVEQGHWDIAPQKPSHLRPYQLA